MLLRTNPDGSGSSDECEGVVTDEVCGAFEPEGDGVVGEGADGSELVSDTEDDAGGVGSVGGERSVVGDEGEFSVGPAAREASGDDLLVLDVAVDAEVSPAVALLCLQVAAVEDEGRMGEVFELGAVGIELGDEFPWG